MFIVDFHPVTATVTGAKAEAMALKIDGPRATPFPVARPRAEKRK